MYCNKNLIYMNNEFELFENYVNIYSSYDVRSITKRVIKFNSIEDLITKANDLVKKDNRYKYSVNKLISMLSPDKKPTIIW